MIKLDVGCGSQKREGYVGIDLVEAEGVDYVLDVRSGFPFVDGEVDLIYSSHFLEHVTGPEGLKILKECYRILKRPGIMEIMVPDFVWCCQEFLKQDEEIRWGWSAMRLFGLQTHTGEYHKNGFSAPRLKAMLEDAGFEVQAIVPVWSHDQRCLVAKAVKKDG